MIINRSLYSSISTNLVSMRKNTIAIRKTLIKSNKQKQSLRKSDERSAELVEQNKKRELQEQKQESKKAFSMPNWRLNLKNPLKGFSIPGLGILGGVVSFFAFGLLGWMLNHLPKIIKSIKDFLYRARKFLEILTDFWDIVKGFFQITFDAFESLYNKLGFGGTEGLGEGDDVKVKERLSMLAGQLKKFILELPKRITGLVRDLMAKKAGGENEPTDDTTGIEEYDPEKKYKVGDIVNKEGKLRQFDGLGWAELKGSKLERDILAFRQARTKFGVSSERQATDTSFNLAIRELRGAAGGSSINPLADDLSYQNVHKGRAHKEGYGFDVPIANQTQAKFVIEFFRSRGYETIHGRGEDPTGGHDFHVHVQAPHAKAKEFLASSSLSPTTVTKVSPPPLQEPVDYNMGPKREVINRTVEIPIPPEVLNRVKQNLQPSEEYFNRAMNIKIAIDGDDVTSGLFD
jgi:hypothetical protein